MVKDADKLCVKHVCNRVTSAGAVMDGQNCNVVFPVQKNCFGGVITVIMFFLRTYHNLLNEGAIVILITFTKEHSVDQANYLPRSWSVKDGLA